MSRDRELRWQHNVQRWQRRLARLRPADEVAAEHGLTGHWRWNEAVNGQLYLEQDDGRSQCEQPDEWTEEDERISSQVFAELANSPEWIAARQRDWDRWAQEDRERIQRRWDARREQRQRDRDQEHSSRLSHRLIGGLRARAKF